MAGWVAAGGRDPPLAPVADVQVETEVPYCARVAK